MSIHTEKSEQKSNIQKPLFSAKKKRQQLIGVIGKEWFDRVNGNSYCAVRIYLNGQLLAKLPFEYGYGDCYLQRANEWLKSTYADWDGKQPYSSLFGMHEKIEGCLKRDVIAWGAE